MLNKPVSDLNLSVRARKCMNRLGINTLGELVNRTADELLESKNFGMTSLSEVREKLATVRSDAPRRLNEDEPDLGAGRKALAYTCQIWLFLASGIVSAPRYHGAHAAPLAHPFIFPAQSIAAR